MFDESSGQVYREWTMPRQSLRVRGSDRDWSRRTKDLCYIPKGTKGPRCLIDMATHVVADNIGDVTEALLGALPNRVLWRVWSFLQARGVCLHAWKLFSKVLVAEHEDRALALYLYRQNICRPTDELKVYTQPLVSLTTDFLSHLVITGDCQFSTSELLCLTDLKNLGVLELIQPADEFRTQFLGVNDRLVRGWTETDNPFPLLRVLRIRVDKDITQSSLRWVSKFRSLSLYDVTACSKDWKNYSTYALETGWQAAQSVAGNDDSFSRYLMLFAPAEKIQSNRLEELGRRVDAHLTSLCSDSHCTFKTVAGRRAPPLLEYLTDNARACMPTWDIDAAMRNAYSCHGTPFEAWAFWVYSFIGQVSGDQDLFSHGLRIDQQAVAGPFVLPAKPMASLFLGQNGRGGITNTPSYVARSLCKTKHLTFTRHGTPTKKGTCEPSPPQDASDITADNASTGRQASTLRSNKRQRLNDILQSLAD